MITRSGNTFTERAVRRYPGGEREFPSLCLLPNKIVLLSGGKMGRNPSESCLVYNMSEDVWKSAPNMDWGRTMHSSCYLDGKVYVFCGMVDHRYTNSIETIAVSPSGELQGEW